jgi:hypothetical protein
VFICAFVFLDLAKGNTEKRRINQILQTVFFTMKNKNKLKNTNRETASAFAKATAGRSLIPSRCSQAFSYENTINLKN